MTLTAAQAIRKECRWCSGSPREQCITKVCKLHPEVFECRSSVKRIKTHCLDCAAQDLNETKYQAAKNCKGDLLRENGNSVRWKDGTGMERGICFLHPYRMGKNPNRPKRTVTPSQFTARTTGQTQKSGPESTIIARGVVRDRSKPPKSKRVGKSA